MCSWQSSMEVRRRGAQGEVVPRERRGQGDWVPERDTWKRQGSGHVSELPTGGGKGQEEAE